MKNLLICILFLTLNVVYAQIVNIPDAIFKANLVGNATLNTNADDEIQVSEAQAYTSSISCSSSSISDLTGIEAFTSLTYLFCAMNNLTTLDVSKNIALIGLYCNYNQLATLDVSKNTVLKSLDCSDNKLQFLDVSKNLALVTLACGNYKLQSLDVSKNLALTYLRCINGQLSFLDLTKNTALETLFLWNNYLTSLDVSKNLALQTLDCGYNQLTSLDFSKNIALIYLKCYSNYLTSLDLSMNTNLNHLDCSINHLTSLNLSNNKFLYDLDCSNNQLTYFSEFPNSLNSIYCNKNLLQYFPDLPLKLHTLDCNNNNNLACLPILPKSLFNLYILNTNIKCLPNAVNINKSDVDIKSFPICDISNACPYYGNISGNIHLDTSATCQLDSLYQGSKIKNIKVNLYNNGLIEKQYFVNYYGDYTFITDLDETFLVKIDTINNPFEITCPSNQEYQVDITAINNIKQNLNYGLTCKEFADYGVSSISAKRFRPGFQTYVFIDAGDIAKSFHGIDCGFKQGGTVKTEIFGPVSYVKPGDHALTPSSITNNNQTLIYNIADFGALFDSSFNIVAITKSPITVADSAVYIKVTVFPDTKDNNPSNDSLTLCFPVRNSHDPNAKEVFPNTKVAGNQFVYYTVYFQNTGNDTAYTVVIKDTLSNKLNASSFQFLNSSHRVITELENNVVTFTCPRINLIDSLTNESLSHGFVQFRIKTDPSVNVFTEIDNTANIYFDTNDPILTNVAYINHLTTSSTALALNKEKIFVYPNPTKNSITVTLKTSDNYKLIVSNTFGQPVLTKSFNDNFCTVLLDGLASGVYYVTVKNDSGYWVEKVVKE